jgi:hypothetical protein
MTSRTATLASPSVIRPLRSTMVTPSTCRVLVFSFSKRVLLPKSSGSIAPRTMGLAKWGCLHGSEGFHRDRVIQAGNIRVTSRVVERHHDLTSHTGLGCRALCPRPHAKRFGDGKSSSLFVTPCSVTAVTLGHSSVVAIVSRSRM